MGSFQVHEKGKANSGSKGPEGEYGRVGRSPRSPGLEGGNSDDGSHFKGNYEGRGEGLKRLEEENEKLKEELEKKSELINIMLRAWEIEKQKSVPTKDGGSYSGEEREEGGQEEVGGFYLHSHYF